MHRPFSLSSIAISLVIATAATLFVATIVNHSFDRGRAVGKCDVVLMLDASMRKKGPAFAAPNGLIARCKALTKEAEHVG